MVFFVVFFAAFFSGSTIVITSAASFAALAAFWGAAGVRRAMIWSSLALIASSWALFCGADLSGAGLLESSPSLFLKQLLQ